jgi:hypothetical protein
VTPTEPKTSKANSWSDINSRYELRNLRNFENRDFFEALQTFEKNIRRCQPQLMQENVAKIIFQKQN